MAARVFGEPLVPFSQTLSQPENDALAAAITAFLGSGGGERTAPLEQFLASYPASRWQASLLTSLGVVYRRTGYFTRAMNAWETAWSLSRTAVDARGVAVADRALGELMELNSRLGRYERLEQLFAGIGSRDVRGSAAEKVSSAREGLWLMRNKPEDAFRCGPMALDRILAFGRANYRRDAKLTESRSTPRGMSLVQIRDLAGQVGLLMQMAKREPGAEILLPAVLHWKAGHFAALIRRDGDRYLVQDPTFGDDMWVTRAALDEEGSGYTLVSPGDLPPGWKPVGVAEGGEVWGKGTTNGGNTQQQKPQTQTNPSPTNPPCGGMAGYGVHTMLENLTIVDTPVGYSPPRGPRVDWTVRYNQRDVFQPQVFSYSNFGPKWTSDLISYIEDNPAVAAANVNLYVRGGGQETYSGFDAGTQTFAPHYQSQALVVRTSASPIRYERRLPDGSVEVYSQPDGASAFPRKVFLTDLKDAQGDTLHLTWDASLRIVGITDAIGQVTTVSYELAGDPLRITKVTDPFGRFATFEYNPQGRLKKITDVIGIASEFTYATQDRIDSLTTPYGITKFAFGDAGRDKWIEITDPLGGRERLEYRDQAPVPASEPMPAGFTPAGFLDYRNTFYWDKRAMIVAPGDYSKAQVFHWLHGGADFNLTDGVLESEKKPLENRVWYQYANQPNYGAVGSSANPTRIARLLDDGSTQTYTYEYNSKGKKIKEIDPVGRETVYVYGTGSTPDADQGNGTGIDLLQIKQKNGAGYDVVASHTYNSQHERLTETDAAGQTTTTTYTASGQVETVTTPPRAGITEDRTTTYTYDPVTGNVAGVTGPGGVSIAYTYDGYSRMRTTTDNEGYTLTYDYDTFNRPTRITYPDGTYEETQYDKLDPARKRDRLGRWGHTFHDALRRVVSTRDALGRTVSQNWCTCGSLEKLIDPNGNATTREHDIQGRLTREVRADGSAKEFTYETTTSRLKKVKDARLQEIQYTYGLDNRRIQTSYVNAEHSTPTVSLSYTDPATSAPDAHGRLRQVTDGTGVTRYSYLPITGTSNAGAGQLASVDGPLADDTISYAYDELGRVVSRTLNSVTTIWAYDALGRLMTLGDPIGNITYSYVGSSGRTQSVTYPNGQISTHAYLSLNQDLRLQEIHHKNSTGATLNKFSYTYDAVGNILAWAQQTDANPAQTYTFEYDRADELTAATLAAPTPKRYRYGYDPGGNRTVEQIDDAVTAATYDNMNRLTAQVPGGALAFRGTLSEPATVTVGGKPATVSGTNVFNGTAQVGSGTSQVSVQATDPSGNVRTNVYEVAQSGASKSFTYDPNGNLTGDGAKIYEWDAENRLTAVKQGATTLASFTYDGEGRRATKTESGITTTFTYDGPHFLEERMSTGPTKRYVYGPGVDRPIAQIAAATTTYYVADQLGSVARITDSTANPILTRDYDPWGNLLQGSTAAGYAFTGREWDPDIALYYYRARYYDPKIGRFISEDPIGFGGGGNLYVYAESNPIAHSDPTGLLTTCIVKKQHEYARKTGDPQTKECPCGCEMKGQCLDIELLPKPAVITGKIRTNIPFPEGTPCPAYCNLTTLKSVAEIVASPNQPLPWRCVWGPSRTPPN